MEKEKVLKILFILSFLPYVLLLLLSVYNAFFGFTFFMNTTYGIEAFRDTFSIYAMLGIVYVPVLPIVFVYEVGYLVWRFLKKRKA